MSAHPRQAVMSIAGIVWSEFETLSEQLSMLTEENPDLFENERFCKAFDNFYSNYKLLDADNAAGYALKVFGITKTLANLVSVANALSVNHITK